MPSAMNSAIARSCRNGKEIRNCKLDSTENMSKIILPFQQNNTIKFERYKFYCKLRRILWQDTILIAKQ